MKSTISDIEQVDYLHACDFLISKTTRYRTYRYQQWAVWRPRSEPDVMFYEFALPTLPDIGKVGHGLFRISIITIVR